PPYATCIPEQVRVQVGDVIRLQCLAHGTPPVRFHWTRVRGSMPPRAQITDGALVISQARSADAGTYKCVASNKWGSSEAQVKVTIRSHLFLTSNLSLIHCCIEGPPQSMPSEREEAASLYPLPAFSLRQHKPAQSQRTTPQSLPAFSV
ncbi:hypothetical protein JZ751_020387, partial [Albula glossodonta]